MKNKITIDDQIQHMKSKGIKFYIMSENDAKDFLSYKTYYFKLKTHLIKQDIDIINVK